MKHEADSGYIAAMWVAPAVRGTGTGRRILDAACSWLIAQGCRTLALWATDSNTRAETLYARSGFARTGVTRPLRDGSPLRSVEMARRVFDE